MNKVKVEHTNVKEKSFKQITEKEVEFDKEVMMISIIADGKSLSLKENRSR